MQINNDLRKHLTNLAAEDLLPKNHLNYLYKLRDEYHFSPKVVYDIGACVLHWTKKARDVWPEAEYLLFDAFEPASFLYTGYRHFVGVLSNNDDKVVRFYQNDYLPGGNSYYREIGCQNGRFFPEDKYIEKKCNKLDTIVKEHDFPLPDLVKIDVQGCERDIIMGALNTFANTKYMIVEMQHTNYNDGAPTVDEAKPFIESLGWKCIAERIHDNGPDADYCFVNTRI